MESDSEDEKAAKSSAWSRGLLIACWAFAGVVVLGVFLDLMLPTGHNAKRSATLSNVHEIAIGLTVYAADNDDLFPPQFSTTHDIMAALPYLSPSDRIFTSLNPAGAEIVPNEHLAGFPEPMVISPAFTALVFESKNWPDVPGACYGFVDGHVRFVRDASLVQMYPGSGEGGERRATG